MESRLAKQLESVDPVVAQEPRDAPQRAEEFEGARGFGLSRVAPIFMSPPPLCALVAN